MTRSKTSANGLSAGIVKQALIFAVMFQGSAHAQTADLNKELHNPLSSLREVFFQVDVLPNSGPSQSTAWDGSIQPVWPFSLGQEWKLVTYAILPMVSEPMPDGSTGRISGIGDTQLFGYFVPPNENKILWGFGPSLVTPTHTDDVLGNDKWSAGPTIIVGSQPGNWSIFGLLSNVWSFAGSGERVNQFSFQYDVAYQLPDGWFLVSNWIVEADWEAPHDDRWTVPVGGGFGRLFSVGNQQVQAYGQIGYNVVRPEFSSDWRAILTMTLVF